MFQTRPRPLCDQYVDQTGVKLNMIQKLSCLPGITQITQTMITTPTIMTTEPKTIYLPPFGGGIDITIFHMLNSRELEPLVLWRFFCCYLSMVLEDFLEAPLKQAVHPYPA